MMIEAITVSVNYDDYLKCSLPHILSQVDSLIVATSPEDEKTKNICRKHGIQFVATEAIHSEYFDNQRLIKPIINKGGALREALSLCKKSDWILFLDADIVLPPWSRDLIEAAKPNPQKLYGATRSMCLSYDEWRIIEISKFKSMRSNPQFIKNPIGFFQLFHSSKNEKPIDSEDACIVDIDFRNRWPKNLWDMIPDLTVLHLGQGKVNWRGRVSPRFQKGHSPKML